MSKTIIEVKCTDQVLTLTNTPVIASGGVGEDYVSVEFCVKWNDYAPALLFWRKGVDPIPVLQDADGFFPVPAELTGVDGIVYFGAVGYDANGNRRTSEAISYRLEAGAITEGTELPAPSGDVFDQIMAHYADVKLYVATRVDDAADAAEQAGENAQAALAAAEQAERHAEDAVDAIESVIYPGIVQATKNASSGDMIVPLSVCPPEKMFLTIKAPMDSVGFGSLYITYPGDGGAETNELCWVTDGYQKQSPGKGIGPGDVVTVLFTRPATGKPICYPLNSRITKTVLDEMNQRLYPGIPASKTTDGIMAVSLNYVPEDKMVLVFAADEASSQVTKFQLEYETIEDGLVQVEYALCDANNSPVKSYGFYAGDYVVTLLTPGSKRATVLNPRVTRDTLDLIRGVLDNVPQSSGGCEVVTYTGSGEMSIYLSFSATPKVIHIDSLANGGYNVSVTIYRDEQVAKLRVFSEGEYWEDVVSTVGGVTWGKSVLILLSDYWVSPGQLNVNNTKYIATGFM